MGPFFFFIKTLHHLRGSLPQPPGLGRADDTGEALYLHLMAHGCHFNKQVCVREMGEKEKWKGLCTRKRGGAGDGRMMRASLM